MIILVPHDDQRPAELLVGGVQQPGVVRFGEALALIAARAAPVLLPPARSAIRGQRPALIRITAGCRARGQRPPPPVRRHPRRPEPLRDLTVTGPASIISAAASRTCSRRARSAAVSPPPSGYLMPPA
jgi:hypothetical protein